LSNDLEKPLGTDIQRATGERFGIGRALGLSAAALALVASAYVAFQGTPFSEPSKPQEVAVQTPAEVKAEEPKLSVEEEAKAAEEALAARSKADNSSEIQPGDAATPGIKISDPTNVAQAPAVAHIPDPALLEETDQGRLPVRAKDGRRPLDVYARPWSGKRGARVAIMIGGMGVSQTTTQTAIEKLPPEVTLGFAPQGNSLSRWAQMARRKGHEILLQVPMEPFDYPKVDPGRGTLIADADPQANIKVLHESMGRLTNYTGVVNYLGARFTSETAALEPVMADLSERGLLYLDDGTSARSKADVLAAKNRAAFAAADGVIDLVQDKNEILKALDSVEAQARAEGSAIAVGTSFDVTIDAVNEWVKEAKKRGIEVVGVSALVTDPER
jgi:polysaccharide deacetylase 2 family uncharacterized protein YibQ